MAGNAAGVVADFTPALNPTISSPAYLMQPLQSALREKLT